MREIAHKPRMLKRIDSPKSGLYAKFEAVEFWFMIPVICFSDRAAFLLEQMTDARNRAQAADVTRRYFVKMIKIFLTVLTACPLQRLYV